MKTKDTTIPSFSRGFLLSEKASDFNFPNWKKIKFDDLFLEYDNKNIVTLGKNSNSSVLAVGHILDINNFDLNEEEIVNKLTSLLVKSELDFFNYLDELNGRFVIFYKRNKNSNLKVLNDATGMRSVFYTKSETIFASHPSLIGKKLNLKKNNNGRFLNDYSGYYLPGNTTLWDGVYQLVPNHLYCNQKKRLIRFFPRKELEECENEDEVSNWVALKLKEQIEALNKRQKILFSLTAGIDSRVALSATKQVSKDIDYFTYTGGKGYAKEIHTVDEHVVSSIVDNLDLNHKYISIDSNKKDLDAEIKLRNKLLAECHTSHNSILAGKYYEHFSKKEYIHIRSNVLEIVRHRGYFEATNSNIDSLIECYSKSAVKNKEIRNIFAEFFNEVNYDKIPTGYYFSDLYYWEYRLGMWHSLVLLESDPSFDTFIIFNNRVLLKKLLSIPRYIRNNEFYLALASKNWPVLEFWNVNNKLNISEYFSRSIHLPNSLMELSNAKIESGSTNKSRVVHLNTITKSHSIRLNLVESAPKKNDYFSIKIDLSNKIKNKKELSILYSVPYLNSENHDPAFQISLYINNNIVSSKDTLNLSRFNLYKYKLGNHKEFKIEVKLKILRNCEPWNWGRATTLNLEKICLY